MIISMKYLIFYIKIENYYVKPIDLNLVCIISPDNYTKIDDCKSDYRTWLNYHLFT